MVVGHLPCSNSGCRFVWGYSMTALLYSGRCNATLLRATAEQIDVSSLSVNGHEMLALLCLSDD